jgi:UDP-N-acetylmuramoyl-tripeptide--D-alanyl-D-alanine ligase
VIKLVLSEVIEAMRAQVRGEPPTVSVGGVSTDSRSVRPGELFFALRGPRFDGHSFVPQVLERGAVAAVIAADRLESVFAAFGPRASTVAPRLILVDDPLAALGRLAAYHRRQRSADVIAVVGSNGKTTTKEMITHVLSGRLRGRCSPKSFNNAVGVPLTLLSAEGTDDFLVVEIGTNVPGEVAVLAAMASPDMAVITCIAEEHLEGLGDVAGVAAEECSVLRHLRPGGFAAVTADSPHVAAHLPASGLTLVTFGEHESADLRITDVRYQAPWLDFEINGRFPYRLHTAGAHNACNAAAAIAVARRLGFEHEEIAARLASFVPPPMRGEVIRVGKVTLVNDTYNANPHSALAAISVLNALSNGGRRIVVFGEMRELGAASAELHRKVARKLRGERVDHVLLVGEAGPLMYDALRDGDLFSPSVETCQTVEECVERLASILRDGDVVLLKASRAVELDRLVEPLRQRLSAQDIAQRGPGSAGAAA